MVLFNRGLPFVCLMLVLVVLAACGSDGTPAESSATTGADTEATTAADAQQAESQQAEAQQDTAQTMPGGAIPRSNAVDIEMMEVRADLGHHTFALVDGTVYTWDPSYAESEIIEVMRNVSSVCVNNYSHTVILQNDGSAWSLREDGLSLIAENVRDIGEDRRHLVTRDGNLWHWPSHVSQQFGNTEYAILMLENVATVSAARNHIMAIRTDGSLWAWGSNLNGQLGIDAPGSFEPRLVLENVVDVKAVNWDMLDYTMALTDDGRLWAWGSGHFGTGHRSNRSTPTIVLDNISSFSTIMSNLHGGLSIAIGTGGELWLWGVSTMSERETMPRQILDDVVDAKLFSHTLVVAVRADGSTWAWGSQRAFGAQDFFSTWPTLIDPHGTAERITHENITRDAGNRANWATVQLNTSSVQGTVSTPAHWTHNPQTGRIYVDLQSPVWGRENNKVVLYFDIFHFEDMVADRARADNVIRHGFRFDDGNIGVMLEGAGWGNLWLGGSHGNLAWINGAVGLLFNIEIVNGGTPSRRKVYDNDTRSGLLPEVEELVFAIARTLTDTMRDNVEAMATLERIMNAENRARSESRFYLPDEGFIIGRWGEGDQGARGPGRTFIFDTPVATPSPEPELKPEEPELELEEPQQAEYAPTAVADAIEWMTLGDTITIPADWFYDKWRGIEIIGTAANISVMMQVNWETDEDIHGLLERASAATQFLFDNGNSGSMLQFSSETVWINGNTVLYFWHEGSYDDCEIIDAIARSLR